MVEFDYDTDKRQATWLNYISRVFFMNPIFGNVNNNRNVVSSLAVWSLLVVVVCCCLLLFVVVCCGTSTVGVTMGMVSKGMRDERVMQMK